MKIKNLHMATTNELKTMLELAIGKTFRLASEGNLNGAMKSKEDAKEINKELVMR